jgi:hypothetical protein
MSLYRHALLLLSLLLTCLPSQAAYVVRDCRPLNEVKTLDPGKVEHPHGILWRISRQGMKDNYLFGTIHLADRDVTNLPAEVESVFNQANSFVMEALLDGKTLVEFGRMFFYQDGKRLSSMMSEVLFKKTVHHLSQFSYPLEVVDMMKPWAAYLVLNGPEPGGGMPLDMMLMDRAKRNGIAVYGLETLKEQGQVLEGMSERDQLSLLRDSVCHHSKLRAEIAEMKSLYLQRDLGGLMSFAHKYVVGKDKSYERLMNALLWRRNLRMVKRLKPMLVEGNAFIAVGALHLPGERGLLRLLEKMGYQVSAVY